jgi:4-hydroxy-3-methylbut-2-enyl diphosphate reductase
VHREAERHFRDGRQIVLIGHAGHPEVIGTMGQLPAGAVLLIESVADVDRLTPADGANLAYITQTTLSVDDTAEIVAALRRRFPTIAGPRKEDICYATTNRQAAIKAIAPGCDAVIVIGAPNSSNSLRLREVAARAGCTRALLIQRAAEIDWAALGDARRVGITAGASAPELLVEEVIAAFRARYEVTLRESAAAREDVQFKLPHALEGVAAAG